MSNRRANEWAIVIFLPEGIMSQLIPLREQYDPDYNSIEPHLSIVFPFESKLSLEELSPLIASEVSDAGPLRIELDSVGDFYPSCPLIFWAVKENRTLNHLYKSLYAKLDLPLPHKCFVPHVTIGREISPHRVMLVKDRIASYVSRESFQAAAVDLVSPIVGDKWVSVRTFQLPEEQSTGK